MKPYRVTKHAVDQAVDRFEWERSNAESRIKQLMQTAVYQGDDGKGRVFDHYRTRTRFILARDNDTVVTVYSMDTVKPVVDSPTLSSAIVAAVKRELSKAGREFKRQQRAIQSEVAALHFELADAMAKQARVYHPPTVERIQRKIDTINATIYRKQSEIADFEAEYKRIKTDAQRFVSE